MCTESEDSERIDNPTTAGGSAGDGPDDLLHEGVIDLYCGSVPNHSSFGRWCWSIESIGVSDWTGFETKLECLDDAVCEVSKAITRLKAVKDRLEREFMVEFERSKK